MWMALKPLHQRIHRWPILQSETQTYTRIHRLVFLWECKYTLSWHRFLSIRAEDLFIFNVHTNTIFFFSLLLLVLLWLLLDLTGHAGSAGAYKHASKNNCEGKKRTTGLTGRVWIYTFAKLACTTHFYACAMHVHAHSHAKAHLHTRTRRGRKIWQLKAKKKKCRLRVFQTPLFTKRTYFTLNTNYQHTLVKLLKIKIKKNGRHHITLHIASSAQVCISWKISFHFPCIP